MRYIKHTFLILALLLVTACTPQDPSKYDLKSPCVSNSKSLRPNGVQGKDPCIPRTPEMNLIYQKYLV